MPDHHKKSPDHPPSEPVYFERLRKFAREDRRLLDVLFFDLRAPLSIMQSGVELLDAYLDEAVADRGPIRDMAVMLSDTAGGLMDQLDALQVLRIQASDAVADVSPETEVLRTFAARQKEVFRVLMHDLRGPASLIQGSLVLMVDMLDDDELDRDAMKALAGVVQTSTSDLFTLIDRLQFPPENG